MHTRNPEHATAARAKAGLVVTVTLMAGLALSAGPLWAQGVTASPATTPAAANPVKSTTPAAAPAHAPAKPVAKSATTKPASNAMVMPKDAPKPGQTAPVAAAKPVSPAPNHASPVAAAKPVSPAPNHASPVAAAKPVSPAPNHASPVAAAKPVSPAPAQTAPAAAAKTATPALNHTTAVAAAKTATPAPAQTAKVAAAKPAAVLKPAVAPAGKTAPVNAGSTPAAKSGATTQALKSGAVTGATIATASRTSNVKVTPMVPPPAARAASGVGAAKPSQPPAQLDEHVTYQYNTLGRRDPFQSFIDGSFVGEDVGGDAPIDVGGMKVVGVVWGESDRFAMVEDGRGNSHVLRRGDKVMNGFVEDLKQDGVVVNLTADGLSQSVTIPLTRKGDKNASR